MLMIKFADPYNLKRACEVQDLTIYGALSVPYDFTFCLWGETVPVFTECHLYL